mgnify:CR=1 FL=1
MAISDISSIEVKGNCFIEDTELKIFESINQNNSEIINNSVAVVYGKNGEGKTTISDEINKLRTEENQQLKLKDVSGNIIELSEEELRRIFVYSENFIDKNVKFNESGLKSIIMFGKQVELDDKIKEKEDLLKKYKSELTKSDDKIKEFTDIKSVKSPDYYINKIKNYLKGDNSWADVDRKIKGNKNKTPVDVMDIVSVFDTKDSLDEIEKEFKHLEEIFLKKDSNFSSKIEKLELIKNSKEIEENIQKLLKVKFTKNELTENESKILEYIKNGQQVFYENVKEYFKKDVDICPYCLRKISEQYRNELVKDIENILNDEINQYKTKLEDLIILNIEINETYKEIDEILYKDLVTLIKKYDIQKNKINELIKKKKNNVYEMLTENELENVNISTIINDINTSFERLNTKIEEINNIIENKEKTKQRLILLNKKIYYYKIQDDYNNYKKFREEKEKEIANNELIKKNIKTTKTEITTLNAQKNNIHIALDKLNKYLEYILFDKNRLKLECRDNEYFVKVNGKDVKLKDLSLGERNIISLAYFFTLMLEENNEDSEFEKDSFIVIDDPISSVDSDNKIGIYSFLRMMFYKIIKNSNSKIICFSHNLEVIFNLEKTFSDIGKAKMTIKELRKCKLNEFKYRKYNEYSKMLTEIYEFANKEEGYEKLEYTIGNQMRKVLEAYATFNYKKGIENISTTEEILNKIEDESKREYFRNFMYRLILNGDSHMEETVRSYPNNTFFDHIDINEKIITAKSLLVFLYLIDDTHIKMYFSNKKEVENIESWCNQI